MSLKAACETMVHEVRNIATVLRFRLGKLPPGCEGLDELNTLVEQLRDRCPECASCAMRAGVDD